MYLGRIVSLGMTPSGRPFAAYRVSSRSFPNRTAVIHGETVSVIPRPGHESDLAKNPYIAYNCIRLCGSTALATNGSHTDPIIEKIAAGMSLRDAFTLSLLALDYEHDSLDTPRIAAAVDAASGIGMMGIIRKDAVLVRSFVPEPGKAFYLSTYEKNSPRKRNLEENFRAENAEDTVRHMIGGGVFAGFEHPVTGAAALWNGTAYELAALNA